MGSSGGSEYKESPETRALTAQQTQILKTIQSDVEQFEPMTYSLLGLKKVGTDTINPEWEKWNAEQEAYKTELANYEAAIGKAYAAQEGGSGFAGFHPSNVSRPKAPTGKEPTKYLTNYSWENMTEEERVAALQGTDRQMYDLQQLQYQRLLDAYNGNAAISPSLEADLAKQKSLLEQTLSQKLGANWATSTPGIQAMAEFEKNAELQRETARQNEISRGQSLLLQNLGYQSDTSQQKLSNFVNVPSARYQGNLSSGNGLLNSMIQRDASINSYNASTQGVSSGTAALSGAASGASIGSAFGPWGAAIGGVAGGIGGLLAS